MLQSQWDIGVRAATEEPWREKQVAGGLHRGARQAASPADWSCWEGREARPPGTAAGRSEGERERREGRLRDNK